MMMQVTVTVPTPPSAARTWRAKRWHVPSRVSVTG